LAGTGAAVPDGYVVVRGGNQPLPPSGTPFSGAAGVDKWDAARGVPHGTIRVTTPQAIRADGGQVHFKPEPTRAGNMNHRHVEVIEGKPGAFGAPEPNPVPKLDRIA
jgi:hypothetical protein